MAAGDAKLADLRHVSAVLANHDDDAVRDHAAAVRRFLDGAVDTVDEALGVRRAPGQRSAGTVAALAERDGLIRAAVARHFGEVSAAAAADALATALSRYRATGWRRERGATTCPARLAGTIEAKCWRILKTGARPPGERRIREILAAAKVGDQRPAIRRQRDGARSANDHEKEDTENGRNDNYAAAE